jgi:alpha-amylase/alpha-mannosidase (GH57 family)
MAKIYICFVWHMHQPFYKDLISGEYHLPWTRLHALKDYYGMVKVLDDFPTVRQTFNLVPSMMVQIGEYAAGKAADPFLRAAVTPAESLTEEQYALILRYFFQAHPSRMIRRFPRYGELYDAWLATASEERTRREFFTPQATRDLQVLSQIAWFDEEFLDGDAEVRYLAGKARDYTIEDQALMARKQQQIIASVLPVYREFARRGQIEISTTPFYHPILPLICDTQIAAVANPGVPLPTPFRYPDDAREQLVRARDYMEADFGIAPRGLWPSEGSVSDQAFTIAADTGFHWTATDNGVLTRTLNHLAGTDETYRPYLWRQDGRELRVIFRDHFLSDLIGFVYSRMGAEEAAIHFLDRIRENCQRFLARGEDALVPVILDGENAWEHYDKNGRPFLRKLYRLISERSDIEALTVSEALRRVRPRELQGIFPGSWINANFDVWIGFDEDNRAWEMLLEARRLYESVIAGPEGAALPEEAKSLAFEELLIAEGSDWCWWYGPHHHTENRQEFDRLFRSHLANVYHALGKIPPAALSRPILRTFTEAVHIHPASHIEPQIDGAVTSYFEWMGSGVYRPDSRPGSMHGRQSPLRELRYGVSDDTLFLRFDFQPIEEPLRVNLKFRNAEWDLSVPNPAVPPPVRAAFQDMLEVAIPLNAIEASPAGVIGVQISFWRGALPADAIPAEGWLDLTPPDRVDWPI